MSGIELRFSGEFERAEIFSISNFDTALEEEKPKFDERINRFGQLTDKRVKQQAHAARDVRGPRRRQTVRKRELGRKFKILALKSREVYIYSATWI